MYPAGLPVSTTWRFAKKCSNEEICSKKYEKFTAYLVAIKVSSPNDLDIKLLSEVANETFSGISRY